MTEETAKKEKEIRNPSYRSLVLRKLRVSNPGDELKLTTSTI